MRDLRSAVAFMVVGNRSCEDIAGLVDEGAAPALVAGHMSNAMFGASEAVLRHGDESARRDRLLAELGPLDVGRTAEPAEDMRLWALGARALPGDPADARRPDRAQLEELWEQARDATAESRQSAIQFIHGSLRRTRFLEVEGAAWIRMFPHAHLGAFEALLDDPTDASRDEILRAISMSEGLYSTVFERQVAVSMASEAEGSDRSYVKHPVDAFELGTREDAEAAKYVEYSPDILRLSFREDPAVELEIDLDLFETLMRIRDGFVPSREELRGSWLNLRVFKDQLAAVPADSLLLSRDNREFHEVQREDQGESLRLVKV